MARTGSGRDDRYGTGPTVRGDAHRYRAHPAACEFHDRNLRSGDVCDRDNGCRAAELDRDLGQRELFGHGELSGPGPACADTEPGRPDLHIDGDCHAAADSHGDNRSRHGHGHTHGDVRPERADVRPERTDGGSEHGDGGSVDRARHFLCHGNNAHQNHDSKSGESDYGIDAAEKIHLIRATIHLDTIRESHGAAADDERSELDAAGAPDTVDRAPTYRVEDDRTPIETAVVGGLFDGGGHDPGQNVRLAIHNLMRERGLLVRVVILFGSELGTSESVADCLADELSSHEVSVYDMTDFDPGDLDVADFHIVVCSTYGDGDLPTGAEPFFDALDATRPDLTGLRFAVFGLGDSVYGDTFNRGGEIAAEKLTERGAQQVGDHARHDASTEIKPKDLAKQWAATLPLHNYATV